ncbi:hypothetical protein THAOC_03349 [Thalassiosira oceanica]|uniref:RanBP2-type domain-containing protein n=1 Tax=Thalassiosira oceanica TaxID=159749 RepID=K0TBR4_THAOC|nr:hypothetical protein THAOC_03349 [Thalassiosira oceanica]|eukprot:EJK74945.1 hypothetical protein THAOC_03349 [Thalassiosira oceanica]
MRLHNSSSIGSAFVVELLSRDVDAGLEWTVLRPPASTGDASASAPVKIATAVHARRSKHGGGRHEDSGLFHALQELGALHRQEVVSALPPLILWTMLGSARGGPEPVVMADMCSAPGSKTLALLDLMHSGRNAGDDLPNGVLVASDVDRNRVITLCQRTRSVSRAPLLTINMDARYFPGMRRRAKSNAAANDEQLLLKEKAGYKQKYDGVLVDAPCSGDGTVRKDSKAWDLSIQHAMSLHRLQRKILRRSIEMLRTGGITIFSTCSMNPLEDEAVVCSVLQDIGCDAVAVVPLPSWLVDEECGGVQGLETWKVPHPQYGKNGVTTMLGSAGDDQSGRVDPTMFPSSDPELASQLRNCRRFLPTSQLDSGGFFVACLQRLKAGELANAKAETKATNTHSKHVKVDRTEQSGSEPSKVREGDWVCSSCKSLNFERRGRCFKCKARKPKADTDEGPRRNLPLLLQPGSSHELSAKFDGFLDVFGIPSDDDSGFTCLNNLFFIKRKSEHTLVVVSDALSRLAITDSWKPVRELGISLASIAHSQTPGCRDIRLYDEGLHVLRRHATKRHVELEPSIFVAALIQTIIRSPDSEEKKRVLYTVDPSLLKATSVGVSWYDSLEGQALHSWVECRSAPAGPFIVSCSCKFSDIEERPGGVFSLCGRVDPGGDVTITTSLRLLAAMLVVIDRYTRVENDSARTKKRRMQLEIKK